MKMAWSFFLVLEKEVHALKSNCWRCGGQRVYGIDGSWQGHTIVHFVGRKGHTVGGYV
jgi:hypothetical protein